MNADSSVLTPGQQIKALLDENYASRLVESRYGFTVKNINELDAYDDRNYYVRCEDVTPVDNPHVPTVAKHGYVLKIINSLDSQKTGFIEAQNELLIFLSNKGFVCPAPVRQKDGSYYSVETIGENGQRHVMRLLIFIPGEVLQKVPLTAELFKKVGSYAAQLDKVLEKFSHPGYDNQTSLWFLSEVPKLRDFFFALDDKDDVKLIEGIVTAFEQKVLPIINKLDMGIIHGDLNENNIIVSSDGKEIEAIIDFGDSHRNCFVFELAICICYMIIQTNDISTAKHVIEGYQMVRQLTKQEKEILKLCVCARMAQSLVLAIYSYQREPDNHYLIRDHDTKWLLLKELSPKSEDEIMGIWSIKN